MANFDKWGRGGAGHLLKHFERAQELNKETGEMEYVKFGNRDIDPSRTHLNYNLAPERPEGQYNFIKHRCSEVYCLGRKDVNVLCSWIVTAPETLDPAKEDEFFRATYKTLADNYGEENVVSAYVHKDESGRSHMHFAFIPVVYDKDKDRFTVNAKKCVTRSDLRNFHPWLEAELEQRLGYHVDVINEATKDGNKTVSQLKQERELAKQQEAAEKTRKAAQELRETQERVETAREDLKAVSGAVTNARAMDEIARAAKTSVFGGKRIRPAEEDDKLIAAAKHGMTVDLQLQDKERTVADLRRRLDLKTSALERQTKRTTELERENGELKRTNALAEQFLKIRGLLEQFRGWRRDRELEQEQEREQTRRRGRGRGGWEL